MTEYRINEFCVTFNQVEAARIMRCSQSAVSQMIAADRDVYIVQHADSTFSHYERKVPGKKAA